MRLSWHDLGTPRADKADDKMVEIAGWPVTAMPQRRGDYFLLTAELNCCAGCVPGNRSAVVEVFAEQEIDFTSGALRLCGTWRLVTDDPSGWRYRSALQCARHRGRCGARHLRAGEACGVGHDQAAGPLAQLADGAAGRLDSAHHARPCPPDRPDARRHRHLADLGILPAMTAFATGFARLAEVVGVDHVGLGTDHSGLVGASALPSYADLPKLDAALRTKFTADETAKILGGNYRRVFEACIG